MLDRVGRWKRGQKWKFGHRLSLDLDFFAKEQFDEEIDRKSVV